MVGGPAALLNALSGLRETSSARAAGATGLGEQRLSFLRSCYAGAIVAIRADNQAAATPPQQRALALADRVDKHREMILRFLHDLAVSFTDNAAEREVRGAKIKQRVRRVPAHPDRAGRLRRHLVLALPPPPNTAATTSTRSPNCSPPAHGCRPNRPITGDSRLAFQRQDNRPCSHRPSRWIRRTTLSPRSAPSSSWHAPASSAKTRSLFR
jgi:hypothetical protein